NTATLLKGNGTGGFTSRFDLATGENPVSVAMGDVNLDGKTDLAGATHMSNSIALLLGRGGGAFGFNRGASLAGYPGAEAIGDLDGDSKPDLGGAEMCGTGL